MFSAENLGHILQSFSENRKIIDEPQTIKDLNEKLVRLDEQTIRLANEEDRRYVLLVREIFVILFDRWLGQEIDDNSAFLFESIAQFWLKISSRTDPGEIVLAKELIFVEDLLVRLNRTLRQLVVQENFLVKREIRPVDQMIKALQRLQRYNHNEQDRCFVKEFYVNMVDCLCSKIFLETFMRSVETNDETTTERFLLFTCTDYLYSHSIGDDLGHELIRIQGTLLQPFARWFNDQSTYFRLWSNKKMSILRQISLLLSLTVQLNRNVRLEKQTMDDFSSLIDCLVNILYSIVPMEHCSNERSTFSLLTTILHNLNSFLASKQLETYLRTKYILSLIMKLIDLPTDELQLNTLRIVSSLINEFDVKHSVDVIPLVARFQSLLEKILRQPDKTSRLNILLVSLKKILRFDSMKTRFGNQEFVDLLFRCIDEKISDSLQVHETLVDIFLSLSFNDETFRSIQQHLSELNDWLDRFRSYNWPMVDCLSWRFNSSDRREQENNADLHFDCMFVYSDEDFDVCSRIARSLTENQNRVHFNREKTIRDKVGAIDRSRFVLLAVSESLKFDLFSRCQAVHLRERRVPWIPLIVGPNCRTDSWLVHFLQGNVFIDFVKLDFDHALNKLKERIQRMAPLHLDKNDIPNIETTNSKFVTIADTSQTVHRPISSSNPIESPSESNVELWTIENVKSFASSHKFVSLQPILNQINGSCLIHLVKMCLDNRESMFQTLRKDLLAMDPSSSPLTLIEYIQFLDQSERRIQ